MGSDFIILVNVHPGQYLHVFFPKKLSLSPPSVVNVVNPTVNLPFGDGSCHPFMCDFWGWFIVGFTTLADWWFGT